MLQPSLAEVKRRSGDGTLIPVFAELLGDLETPVSAYIKLQGGPGSFLLESVDGGERLGRYSFIGLRPTATLTLRENEATLFDGHVEETVFYSDPLDLIDRLLRRESVVPVEGLPRFHGGAVGFLSYDLARAFERLPSPAASGLPLPLGVLGFYQTVLTFDHIRRTIKIITHVPTLGDLDEAYRRAEAEVGRIAHMLNSERSAGVGSRQNGTPLATGRLGGQTSPIQFEANTTRARFEESVRMAKEYIAAGDAIQVVLSQRLSVPTSASPLALYRTLRAVNPSPYMYLLDYGEYQIVGASPEMLVRVEGTTVAVHPIAGTRPRGRAPEEDDSMARELQVDEKELAEHHMLLDLGRNDVGRVSEPGTVVVKQRAEIERYSHVMHLVSHVEGKLRKDLRPVDAVRAGFPAGTVSGAPKVRAMEIIAELEPDTRGPYAGAVGYFGFDGTIVTAIAIRTAVLKDGVAHVQTGAGIVADSVPELEYEETMNKAAAMLKAIKAAETIDEPPEVGSSPAEAVESPAPQGGAK